MPAQQVLRIFLLLSGKTDNVVKDGLSCSVGALETSAPPKCATVRVRRPIGFRPPSDRIPSDIRSDSVRRPIGFRSPFDRVAFAIRCIKLRLLMFKK